MSIHEMKLAAAVAAIREHLEHVAPNGAACYATRADAMAAAAKAIWNTGEYTTAQIEEAFDLFEQPTIQEAIKLADAIGAEHREQKAISLLHEQGYYRFLTCDEARTVDETVRRMCMETTDRQESKP